MKLSLILNIVLGILLLVFIFFISYNAITERGKAYGKMELIDEMIRDSKIPTNYIYCPRILLALEGQNGTQKDAIVAFCRHTKFGIVFQKIEEQ